MYANPKESPAIIAKAYNLDAGRRREDVVRDLLDSEKKGGVPYWGPGDLRIDTMNNMIRAQKLVGAIKGDVDWAKLIDESFLPDDLQEQEAALTPCTSRALRGRHPDLSGARGAAGSARARAGGSRARAGRVLRRGRALGLRQVDAARRDRRTGGADRRANALRRQAARAATCQTASASCSRRTRAFPGSRSTTTSPSACARRANRGPKCRDRVDYALDVHGPDGLRPGLSRRSSRAACASACASRARWC